MALPIMNETFNHVKINLPSGKQIGVRGWKVKDEKELLFALESEENASENKINYIISFLKKCTDDQIKFDTLSETDIKKVCIEVRKISKGELISYGYKCPHCNTPIEDEVNLTKNQEIKKFDTTPIKVNDKLVVTFKDLPYTISEQLYNKYGTSDKKFTYYYIINSIDSITFDDKTYTSFNEQEVIDFTDQLDPNDMNTIYNKFDDKISYIELKRHFKCFKCKEKVEVEFGDLLSFLVL